jgi:hypothetical protein
MCNSIHGREQDLTSLLLETGAYGILPCFDWKTITGVSNDRSDSETSATV